jgi:UDPglucose 6-dehydrogenase
MKIGIIGVGVVGGAVRHGMKKIGQDVTFYDVKLPETSIDSVLDSEVCFICVPTKTNDEGENDTSVVEATLTALSGKGYKGVAVIKSTVIPGTTDQLSEKFKNVRLAFCPEFLRERYAEVDFVENMDVCPIGAYNDADFELIKKAHGNLPQRVMQLTPKEAEFVKYFSNVFNAMRIVFANEFFDVCTAAGVRYQNVKDCAVLRKNIPDAYLECNDMLRGFGGVCLPKDTQAFATYAKKLGLDVKLFDLVVAENKKYPKTVFDGMRGDGPGTVTN